MSDRITCINPRCRRTAAADKFPGSTEIICGKCFRTLSPALRRRQRRWWSRERRFERASRRKDAAGRMEQWGRIWRLHHHDGERVWREMRAFFAAPERPAGLDAFLAEMGLA